jgi:uncharacterized OB-fold protein
VREAGYLDLVPRAIEAALRGADVEARNVDIAILPDTQVRLAQAIGKASGLRAETLAPTPHLQTGDLGSADSFFRLVLALETAAPEKNIQVAGFGQGATALVFRKTAKPSPNSAALALAGGIEDANYSKLLVFRDLLDWDRGMRAETDTKTALSTAYRNDDALTAFVGARSKSSGIVQFPPETASDQSFEPYPLAGRGGSVFSCVADRLAFSVSPPSCYGFIDFDGGGRLMMDFTDPDAPDLREGDQVRFVFRIHDFDRQRGFRKYFWKAARPA